MLPGRTFGAICGSFIVAIGPVCATTPDFQGMLNRAVEQGVPGIQAVVVRGPSEWSGVAGVSRVETKRPMTASDRLRVASITKMMTYATIMKLVEQHNLRLNDRIIDRLPPGTLNGVPHASQITVAQLLEHTSGLHNFNGPNGSDFFAQLYGDPRRGSRIWTARDLIAFSRKPGNAPTNLPGAERGYSSTGYILLEMIAEEAEHRPLPDLYQHFIFRPNRMARTGVEGQGLRGAAIAPSYGRPDSTMEPFNAFGTRRPVRADGLINLSDGLVTYNAWARGAGAVASTACDLSRFMAAVRANRLIVLKDQAKTFADARTAGEGSFNWNGGSAGIQASIFYAPADAVTVIVITNGSNAGPGSLDLGRELFAAALEDKSKRGGTQSMCLRPTRR